MRTPTLPEFKRWAKAHYTLAHAVCVAQAFAQCERERVDAYIKPLFESFDFYVSDKFAQRSGSRERITDPANLYLTDLDAPEYKRFCDECDAAHRAHGFRGPVEHCPALVAEELQRKAENALIKAGADLLGIDDCAIYGEHRAQMLDLLLGACLKREAA